MERAKIIKPTTEQAEAIKKWKESKKGHFESMVDKMHKLDPENDELFVAVNNLKTPEEIRQFIGDYLNLKYPVIEKGTMWFGSTAEEAKKQKENLNREFRRNLYRNLVAFINSHYLDNQPELQNLWKKISQEFERK
ncbi:MAG: hypothetical protein WC460_04000 [Patescibacteria group bacterium]